MAPTIRISDATYGRLKTWAEPFEDKPEDVLQRVLEIAEKHRNDYGGQEYGRTRYVSEQRNTLNVEEENTRRTESGEPVTEKTPREQSDQERPQAGASTNIYWMLDLPDDFYRQSKRARGDIARGLYLEQNGLKDAEMDGRFVHLPEGKWRHVAYSSLNTNGAWWFGADKAETKRRMMNSTLEDFVFLCGQPDGRALQGSLAANRLAEILERLSISDGQLKFNVRHVGGGKVAVIFDGGQGQEALR